jgi:lysophospholipase L1-like esterase
MNKRIKENSVVCCLGDSLTELGGWIYDINDYLARSNSKTRFFNCGIGGNQVSMAPYYLEDEVLRFKPDYVIVMFGANDIHPYLYSKDEISRSSEEPRASEKRRLREKYIANLELCCFLLKQRGAEVILLTPPPFDAVEEHFTTEVCYGCNEELKYYGDEVKKLAEKKKLPCIDLYDVMQQATLQFDKEKTVLYQQDRVHPNEDGFHVMAAAVLRGLGWDVPIPENVSQLRALPFKKTYSNDKRFETEKILRLLSFFDYGFFNPENGRIDRIRPWVDVEADLINRSVNRAFDYWMDQDKYIERTKVYVQNRPRKEELLRRLVEQTMQL